MEEIKNMAQPYMQRSTVFTTNGTYFEVAQYRTSKTAWFRYSYHKYAAQWLQHVQDLTGLNTDNAEDLQIANYGLGGHFEPHFDFFTVNPMYPCTNFLNFSDITKYLNCISE